MAFLPGLPAVIGSLGAPKTLETLLGSAAPSQLQQQKPVPDEEDILVKSPQSDYRDGIVRGGTFRLGGLGGNILGALGDAFLVQSGNAPQYAPRLKEAREAEALKGFDIEQKEAMSRLAQVSPDKAMALRDTWNDNNAQDAETQLRAQIAAAAKAKQTADYSMAVNERAVRLLGSATPKTYAAMRQQVMKYYDARGVTPDFPIPETFDEAGVEALRMSGVPVKDQMAQEDRRDYNEGSIAQRREAARLQAGVGTARVAATDRATTVRERADANRGRVAQQNADTNRYRAENPPARRGAAPSAAGAGKKLVKLPNGKYAIQ